MIIVFAFAVPSVMTVWVKRDLVRPPSSQGTVRITIILKEKRLASPLSAILCYRILFFSSFANAQYWLEIGRGIKKVEEKSDGSIYGEKDIAWR